MKGTEKNTQSQPHLDDLQAVADETVRLVKCSKKELARARRAYLRDAGICPRCGGKHTGSHCQRPTAGGHHG